MEFDTLKLFQKDPNTPVVHLLLNRPSTRNAISPTLFFELPKAISHLTTSPSVSAIVVSAAGPHFCSGIDLSSFTSLSVPDTAHSRHHLRNHILALQASVSSLESCPKPVIAAVHGGCVGGGVDLVTACDIRYCTEDAFFSVKEVDLGITADLGTLQRLPRIVGYGNAVEMALTGRRVGAMEAKAMGLVTRVFRDRDEMDAEVDAIAKAIAEKSPLAVMGTKAVLQKSRDMTVEQGLDYVATWNSAVLMSDDLKEAVSASLEKRKPKFSKL